MSGIIDRATGQLCFGIQEYTLSYDLHKERSTKSCVPIAQPFHAAWQLAKTESSLEVISVLSCRLPISFNAMKLGSCSGYGAD